jgi:hypothetical protein
MGFWEFNWHLLWLGVAKAWFILGIISGIIFIVSIIPQFKRSKWGGYMKHPFFQVAPLAIFVIMLIVGLLTSPYKIYKEQENQLASVQNSLQGQIADLRGNVTSVQNELVVCLNQHRPIIRPQDTLNASTSIDEQAHELNINAPLGFINSGENGAYRLRFKVGFAPVEAPQQFQTYLEQEITSPVYPGSPLSAPFNYIEPFTRLGNGAMLVNSKVLLIYCAVRYYDAPTGGHCYEDEFWFRYPLSTPLLASAFKPEVQALEPFVRVTYGNQTQCQEAQ